MAEMLLPSKWPEQDTLQIVTMCSIARADPLHYGSKSMKGSHRVP